MTVAVTQYMFPNGTPRAVTTELPDTAKEAYEYMLSRKWNFAAENDGSGKVVLWIEDNEHERDVQCKIVANGPGIQPAMVEMLEAIMKKRKPAKVKA